MAWGLFFLMFYLLFIFNFVNSTLVVTFFNIPHIYNNIYTCCKKTQLCGQKFLHQMMTLASGLVIASLPSTCTPVGSYNTTRLCWFSITSWECQIKMQPLCWVYNFSVIKHKFNDGCQILINRQDDLTLYWTNGISVKFLWNVHAMSLYKILIMNH